MMRMMRQPSRVPNLLAPRLAQGRVPLSKVHLKDKDHPSRNRELHRKGLEESLLVLDQVPSSKDPNLVALGLNSKDPNLVALGLNSKDPNLVDLALNSKDPNLVDLALNSKDQSLVVLGHSNKDPNMVGLGLNSKDPNLEALDPSNKGLVSKFQEAQANPRGHSKALVGLQSLSLSSRVHQQAQVKAKDQPPNYSTCTQCKQQVCSLCGFSPPDSAGKEWLCLNCQMQRAMGGMEPPGPPMMKQPPKQGSAPPSPQRKEPPPGSPAKDEPGKKPPMLSKQQSIGDTGKGATPPATPKQKSPGPGPQQPQQGSPKGPQGAQPGAPGLKRGQQPPPLQKPAQSPKGSPQPSPAKTTPKQDTGGFFGGFGLGGLTDVKAPAAESVTGKLFGGFGSSSKPQGSTATQASESVTGKLFSGFGGLTETAKPPAATSQASDGVSGKMFGFGSSILSSASNLITGEDPKSPPDSPPGSPPDSPIDSGADSPPGSPPDSGSESPPDTPPAYSKERASPKPRATERKAPADKPTVEPAKAEEPPAPAPCSAAHSSCPLCKVALNIGSGDVPNYSTCTECQKTVCNLCGFNPMPHLSELLPNTNTWPIQDVIFTTRHGCPTAGALVHLSEIGACDLLLA
ncbi:hypothetical protein SRHO_G00002300 [Serrasalmus rhombeus]